MQMDCVCSVCNVLVLHVTFFFIIPVLAELQEAALISAEECEEIAQDYGIEWEAKLLRIALDNDILVIRRITTVLGNK